MDSRSDLEPPVSPEDLETERLRTYIDWADVRAPAWYWPAYAIAISVWLTAYSWGLLWGTLGAPLVVAMAGAGLSAMAKRSQVLMPRFRGMPAPLKRAYLPLAAAALGLAALLLYGAITDGALGRPITVLAGPVLALCGAWTSQRYRVAARELTVLAGIRR